LRSSPAPACYANTLPIRHPIRTSPAAQAYLLAGADWYDFWTNEKHVGGQTVTAAAPIDRIPVFWQSRSPQGLS
jgi:hypothetical protein